MQSDAVNSTVSTNTNETSSATVGTNHNHRIHRTPLFPNTPLTSSHLLPAGVADKQTARQQKSCSRTRDKPAPVALRITLHWHPRGIVGQRTSVKLQVGCFPSAGHSHRSTVLCDFVVEKHRAVCATGGEAIEGFGAGGEGYSGAFSDLFLCVYERGEGAQAVSGVLVATHSTCIFNGADVGGGGHSLVWTPHSSSQNMRSPIFVEDQGRHNENAAFACGIFSLTAVGEKQPMGFGVLSEFGLRGITIFVNVCWNCVARRCTLLRTLPSFGATLLCRSLL